MTQLSSTTSTCAAQWKMWHLKVFSVIYFIAVCAAQDGDVIPYLQPQSKLDAFVSEKVEFSCGVNGNSTWTFTWEVNGQPVQESDGVLSLTEEGSKLTIIKASQAHSGNYVCKGHDETNATTADSNSLEFKVHNPPTPYLKVHSPWLDVFPSEEVRMTCKVEALNNPGWTFIWYRDGQQVREDADVDLDEEESSLNITSASQTHQGVYTCKAQLEHKNVISGSSNAVAVKVYDYTPKPTLNKDPEFNPMYFGEKVRFSCRVNKSTGWEYQWYKDENKLTETNETISINLDRSTRGKYSCKATRGEKVSTARSDKMTQDALEIPVPTLKPDNKWSDVFPTESVQFICEMQSSLNWIWTYTWYREGQLIQAGNTMTFSSNGATLSINSASDSHAGQYQCKGHLRDRSVDSSFSSGFNLTVYDKKPSVILTQDPKYEVMFAGESVSFSCHINGSTGWEYKLFKDRTLIKNQTNKISISPVAQENTGIYQCQAKRGKDKEFLTDFSQAKDLQVQKNKPKPSVIRQPDVDEVYTGESVYFKCTLEISSGWQYSWYKDNALLTNSKNFEIHNATSLDNGTYTCMATRNKTKFSSEHSDGKILRVSEIPVPLVKQGSHWLEVFPSESVKLTCGMEALRTNWKYTWYQDDVEIASDSVSFDTDRTTLTISSASHSHRGRYSCSGNFKARDVTSNRGPAVNLTVYSTRPDIILKQNPDTKLIHTGDQVSFSCHINVTSEWKYHFYKDNIPLDASGNNYNLSSVMTTHSGSYTCKAERGNKVFDPNSAQALELKVKERPGAAIVLLTGWSEVFSTDSLILKCEVEEGQNGWNYTWFKEGKQINQTSSEKYTVTPQNNPEQSTYTCQGIRSGRPSYSKNSTSFATKNLLLKRRVLLSISGCLFFGIILVFIGCIFLRFCRKPEVEYAVNRPEEKELFLTMAQLKDRGDAPCPMVDYITDEALNAPPKEGEENGKICSESTPLPITSPEEEAATAESPDKAENGGGMVSFKQ